VLSQGYLHQLETPRIRIQERQYYGDLRHKRPKQRDCIRDRADQALGGGSTNVVAIVGISATVVLVLPVALCVYKNKKDAQAASSESKAGRAVAVANVA
jgi:hypothetical protein